ncbi:MAG: aldose 1-epimerase family protein [Ancalomicrobiaceae bacterium]|nr:aldose 1-epimerase family protein [Ancalomicrobiaceae bacterium]
MSSTFFKTLDRDTLVRHIGNLDQICDATRMAFVDGPARDMQVIQVQTGGGLAFQILPDRGMGLGRATLDGLPLAWMSALGEVAPWYYNPSSNGWLQSFGGGLMASCGLTNVGGGCAVDGIDIGLHGRLSHIPARDLTITRCWGDDGYRITVAATVLDGTVLGGALRLTRTYTVTMGDNAIRLNDEITNVGSRPEPLFALYHFNFGYPLVSPTATLTITPSGPVEERNPDPLADVADHNQIGPAVRGAGERVFYHHLDGAADTTAVVRLTNTIGADVVEAEMSFPLADLDHLVQWKMEGEGEYVLGLEPGNCFATGRQDQFARGDVEILGAGETKHVHIDLVFRSRPAN